MAAKRVQSSEQLSDNSAVHTEDSNNNNELNPTHQLNVNTKSETLPSSKNESHLRDTENTTITVPKHDVKLTYFKCTEV